MSHFDVIIIGGRPAGSSLAARLGKMGLRTLLLERATFPSLPPASCPIIYAPTMKLLDEIGADESAYARATPKIHRLYLHGSEIQSGFDIPDQGGRNYAYAVDRARFDHALWQTAKNFPGVEAHEGFSVTDLLWDNEGHESPARVTGVIGKDADGESHRFTADLVVGADGRFSMVARKVQAQIRDQHEDYPTTLYYAYWKNLKPYQNRPYDNRPAQSGQAASVAYEGRPGIGYLVMDSADNTAAVAVEGRSELLDPPPGDAEAFYLEQLRAVEHLWDRLQGAEMITSVRGMKNISNLYRQPGGPGWALVGDAYHQKDPLDGQGIYNAVFSAKALAWAIRYWKQGEMDWDEAVEWYDETVRIKTYAMYQALLKRVQVSLYPTQNLPGWIEKRIGRWAMEDEQLTQLFGRFITRQIPPDLMQLMTPPLLARAVLRGGLRELRSRAESLLPFSNAR